MDYALTFLEGLITFVSPCLLPLLPVYVAFFAGDAGGARTTAGQAGTAPDASSSMARTLTRALGFVCGFALLFTLLGAFAGAVGSALVRYRQILNVGCGTILILLGINYVGLLRVPLLNKTWQPNVKAPRGFASSLLFGVVFAVGWSPCVGTFLSSALSMAASSASTWTGVGLLLCYSLGLGVPFILCAVLVNQLEGAITWVKLHYDVVNKVCGVLLIAVGVLMALGVFA